MLLTTRRKAPNTFHRHQPGFGGVHSFKNEIAFYEAVPFLFHLSGRFAENNLNFMQQQLQGNGVSFLPHEQAWLGSQVPGSQLRALPSPNPRGLDRPAAQNGSGGPGTGLSQLSSTSCRHSQGRGRSRESPPHTTFARKIL